MVFERLLLKMRVPWSISAEEVLLDLVAFHHISGIAACFRPEVRVYCRIINCIVIEMLEEVMGT